jgi:hypothetical protein
LGELCPVIRAALFFLDPFAGSVVDAVVGVVVAGFVVVTAGDAAGAAAGAAVVAALGAAPVFGAFSASTGATAKDTNMTAAAAVATPDSFLIGNSNLARPAMQVKVIPLHQASDPICGLTAVPEDVATPWHAINVSSCWTENRTRAGFRRSASRSRPWVHLRTGLWPRNPTYWQS